MAIRLISLILLFILSACGTTETISSFEELSQNYSLTITRGDQQSAYVGTVLPEPLTVVIQGKEGGYLSDQVVEFSVVEGDATIVGESIVLTALDGTASTTIQLGNTASEIKVRAALRINTFDEARHAALFTLTAVAIPAPKLYIYDSKANGQVGTVGQKLPLPLSVIAKDGKGNPVVAQDVEFKVTKGSSDVLVTPLVKTDTNGVAATEVTLGKTAESISIQATWVSNANGDPNRVVMFSIKSRPDAPAVLSFVQGHINGSRRACAAEGSNFPSSVALRLTDQYANAIEGATVTVNPDSRGRIDGLPFDIAKDLVTDAAGEVSFNLTAGSVSGSGYNTTTTVNAVASGNGPATSATFDITKSRYLFNGRGDGNAMYFYGSTGLTPILFPQWVYYRFPFVVSARGSCWSSLGSTFMTATVSRVENACPSSGLNWPSDEKFDEGYTDINGNVSDEGTIYVARIVYGSTVTYQPIANRLTVSASGTNSLTYYIGYTSCN
ncbi:MAG TPA: hypothetical protein VI895_11080 [Bdellovibrionota bacterium]|nr:hypothetical protein [Bdellovibrionota bacterium]